MTDHIERCASALALVDASRYTIVGSTGIVDKPNDVDVLVQVPLLANAVGLLESAGWEGCAGYPHDNFASVKAAGYNLLLTADPAYFDRWVLAYRVCRALKLQRREDRVLVHLLVLDQMNDLDVLNRFPDCGLFDVRSLEDAFD